jgi:hypothetical protein
MPSQFLCFSFSYPIPILQSKGGLNLVGDVNVNIIHNELNKSQASLTGTNQLHLYVDGGSIFIISFLIEYFLKIIII